MLAYLITFLAGAILAWTYTATRRPKNPKAPNCPHVNVSPPPRPLPGGIRFCPLCAATLEIGTFEGHEKAKCSACSFVYWNNPKPVAVAIIPNSKGGVVLVKRKLEPKAGQFAFPGGFIDTLEHPEQGAVREALEETGLVVEVDRLWAILTPPGQNQILFFYLMKPTDQVPVPGSDAEEARAYALDALPGPIAFSTHQQVLGEYITKFTSTK